MLAQLGCECCLQSLHQRFDPTIKCGSVSTSKKKVSQERKHGFVPPRIVHSKKHKPSSSGSLGSVRSRPELGNSVVILLACKKYIFKALATFCMNDLASDFQRCRRSPSHAGACQHSQQVGPSVSIYLQAPFGSCSRTQSRQWTNCSHSCPRSKLTNSPRLHSTQDSASSITNPAASRPLFSTTAAPGGKVHKVRLLAVGDTHVTGHCPVTLPSSLSKEVSR